ncbi:MAG: helix-turn-helix domain-containing protein [Alphaproteobacteria bacterium]|nr:helix-turn-helix domain-containing protein [Alphaproteobacteria bacterium]
MISSSQIRAARAIINAKQSELAKAAGISLATLNNIERGVGDPRTSTLEAIERALSNAGVEILGDVATETVTLHRIERPAALDTFFASQRVLEALGPESLLKPKNVLLFARWNRNQEEERPRVCLFIEGQARVILFDKVDFNLGNGARTAEVAGIMLAVFAFHRGRLNYIDQVLEDTTTAEPDEAVRRLRSLQSVPLQHPSEFIDVFNSWETCMSTYGERAGHPLADLAALFATEAV